MANAQILPVAAARAALRSRGFDPADPLTAYRSEGCRCGDGLATGQFDPDCLYHLAAAAAPDDHSIPWNCPAYWDGCNCPGRRRRGIVVHLSDVHLLGEDLLYGTIDTRAAFGRALEALREIGECDLVVVTGDLAEDGLGYGLLLEGLEEACAGLGADLVLVAGNHDDRALVGAHATTHPVLVPSDGVQVRDLPVARVVALDSSVPDDDNGWLREEQLAALADALADAPGPVLVALHHPPLDGPHGGRFGALAPEARDALAALFATAPTRPAAVLAGHWHYAASGTLVGVPVFVAPALANALDPLVVGPVLRTRPLAGLQRIDLSDGVATCAVLALSAEPALDVPLAAP